MAEAVLVVGAGPVGLTLALELARYGVPVRLVDKMTERSDKSRAVARLDAARSSCSIGSASARS